MPKFPTKEAQIYLLALKVLYGIFNNPVFPNPPERIDLLIKIKSFDSNNKEATQFKAHCEEATKTKTIAFNALTNAMKQNIRYAENTVNYDDNKLKLIGWSARSKPHLLELPGQPLELKADIDDNGNIKLSWKSPADGGDVNFYQVQKRIMPDGNWQNAASCFDTYLILKEQAQNCRAEYIVYAVNKAGKSISSNVSAFSNKR